MRERNYLPMIKICMSLINFLALLFITLVFGLTIQRINQSFSARDFLDNISYISMEPIMMTVLIFASYFGLLAVIEVRMKAGESVRLVLNVAEVLLSIVILRCISLSYKGIILLVIADIVTSIKDKNSQRLFLCIMGTLYVISDYNIISRFFPLISFQDIINVYSGKEQLMFSILMNVFTSLSALLFIVYMIILLKDQVREKARVAQLNAELTASNDKLMELNDYLKDYAHLQKELGETEERNRIAREIHDTLGHTMTGLSAGIDACMALIDYSVEETKVQLGVLSNVARRGLQDVRRSMNKLRPDTLEKHSLNDAIVNLIEETETVSNVKISYHCAWNCMKFKEDEEETIYRIVQEGTTNAIRHGHATEITISIKKEYDWFLLEIKDNGEGCKEIKPGFGLIHMRERVRMLHGEVTFENREGFKILAKIPIRWSEQND